jgi:hypothetical protein
LKKIQRHLLATDRALEFGDARLGPRKLIGRSRFLFKPNAPKAR